MDLQESRKFARILHLVIALFQFVYIYSPLHTWEHGITLVQWVTFPLLLISGGWLMYGHKFYVARQRERLRLAGENMAHTS